MLVEFSVANFKSIREQQTLKLTPVKSYKEHPDNLFSTGRKTSQLLNVAAIYGANSAGKSSLLEAFNYMENFILQNSKMNEGDETDVIPFKLDNSSYLEPSSFEVIFIQDEIRYQYGFSVTQGSVISEWLYVSPKQSSQIWFEREGENKEEWYLNRNLASKSDRETWKRMTRNNALLLSVAVQLNSEKLKPIFTWFKEKIVPLENGDPAFTAEHALDKTIKAKVLNYLNAADLSIRDLDIHEQKVSVDDLRELEKELGSIPTEIKNAVEKGEMSKFKVYVSHINNQREPLNFQEESEGTQKLFALAMPLINVLEKGRVVYIDELNNSLHPFIVRMIIGLFNNSEINLNHAQLIFTTHDASILDRKILRRDQIWFVEKDNELATQLYPLSDFCPRSNESLAKGYLEGKYGAVPFIGELDWT
ncbi:MAG: AAA family ATPase [Methylococcaceae bacterium]|nr:AAA family ATPase [Methylococcaceae bacterium]